MKVAVIYNQPASDAGADEQDVLDQVELACNSLSKLKHETKKISLGWNFEPFINEIKSYSPDLVFNLAESISNESIFAHFPTTLLDYLNIPYTGVKTPGMFMTTNKPLTKKVLKQNGVPVPEDFKTGDINKLKEGKRYLLKPISEEGSKDFDEDLFFIHPDYKIIDSINNHKYIKFFIEEYIDGREFNVSMFGSTDNPKILPLAEMLFENFPAEKPKVMGYKAKWDENSFEYKHTNRTFISEKKEPDLYKSIQDVCMQCWKIFDLQGYARVDIRMDGLTPKVLEINANPCISPGSGFYAACEQAGFDFCQITAELIEIALKK